jgi:DNA-binding NtrC family response regulator
VLNDPALAGQTLAALTRAGVEAVSLASSMEALDALASARRIEVLVTSAEFAPGQPNGVALARMTLYRRPEIKVIFLGPDDDEIRRHAEGLGEFIVIPGAGVVEIVEAVRRLLGTVGVVQPP